MLTVVVCFCYSLFWFILKFPIFNSVKMPETVNTGNSNLDAKILEWLKWDRNEKTLGEVHNLLDKKCVPVLENIMMNRETFGTAGIRGVMRAGFSGMNDLVIIQTSQGLAAYALEAVPEITNTGVVIGHDARHNSKRFAQLAAQAFLSKGIPVYLYSDIVPTPFIPFGVLQLKASVGIMVTASHNPKNDNGYKVYWSNGAQIISPHDKGIQTSILQNLEPWPTAWDIDSISTNPKCKDPYKAIRKKYFEIMKNDLFDKELNSRCQTAFTFTAMHGVSHSFMVEAFQTCGFVNFVPVKEQMDPDPDFPTVAFPNPEEGKSALDLSFSTAEKANSKIVLANDPDADRLAVAEKLRSGDWRLFTGNETGALIGWWLWYCFHKKNPDIPASDVYMLASTVSSKILKAIAHKEGFNFIETLTGFKWMGNRSFELLKKGKTVLFAFEEAIGFMCGTTVLDKDGISAAMTISQLAAYLEPQSKTLYDKLQEIYQDYGIHVSNNSYFICHDQPTIKSIFERIRNFTGPGAYPESLGPYKIQNIRDLTTGFDSSQNDKKAILPTSKSTQMITFDFENGVVATVRTSGTEPKLKYYTEFCAKPGQGDKQSLTTELAKLVNLLIEEFLQPKKNNLIPKSD